jgi:hypothetical protein
MMNMMGMTESQRRRSMAIDRMLHDILSMVRLVLNTIGAQILALCALSSEASIWRYQRVAMQMDECVRLS